MKKKSKLTSKKMIFGFYAYINNFKPQDLLKIWQKKGGREKNIVLPLPQLLKVGHLLPPPPHTSKVGDTCPLYTPTGFQSPPYNCTM
jgi:hypothetical protein